MFKTPWNCSYEKWKMKSLFLISIGIQTVRRKLCVLLVNNNIKRQTWIIIFWALISTDPTDYLYFIMHYFQMFVTDAQFHYYRHFTPTHDFFFWICDITFASTLLCIYMSTHFSVSIEMTIFFIFFHRV